MNSQANVTKQIFVSRPFKDLKTTTNFFGKLGLSLYPMFNSENAACLVISENIYAMLLVEKFFKQFIRGKEICDIKNGADAFASLTAGSRQEVDEMIVKVAAAGRSGYREAQDYG
ncbi:MAG TPA: hypothetical protein VF172_08985 [Nitrososphaera sp.]|jgi:predicted lactoylglutathione lyase